MGANSEKVKVRKDLLSIKDEVRKPVKRNNKGNDIRRIDKKLDGLAKKMEDIKDFLQSDSSSSVKSRKKKEIICFVKDVEKTTASKLSEKMDLSRTRCSEYLNEMEREGILTSEKEGRKKYYRLEI